MGSPGAIRAPVCKPMWLNASFISKQSQGKVFSKRTTREIGRKYKSSEPNFYVLEVFFFRWLANPGVGLPGAVRAT